ncbi:DNA polymerase zeta catalytic subunit, putative [Plasmodium malariae]|uniref:DNA-directed DNA polymerase n=1 Tax=Plasmodium malariae TaxID=5858 RepID=A0A1C3KEC0_PLAMA|nr:DNA polymerase zeta catalytic subunit, putative [Plasmodium malariae]
MNIIEKPTAFFICKFLFFYYIYKKPSFPFDSLRCKINNKKIPHVCVIQILGLSYYGQSVCLYIHDFFPFFYVLIPPEEKANSKLELEICEFLEGEYGKIKKDKRENVCIYNIERVKKKCIYGYNEEPEDFLKIYLLYPNTIYYFASLLKKNIFKNRVWELYEVHINYMLHFLCMKNIYGCSEIYTDKNILFRKEFFNEINFKCFMEEDKWNLQKAYSIENIKRNKYLDVEAPFFFTSKTTNVNFSNLKRETLYDIECDIKHEHILNDRIYSYEFEKHKIKWKQELNFDLPVKYLDSFSKLWIKEKKRCKNVNPDLVRSIFNFEDFDRDLNLASFDILTERTKNTFGEFLNFMKRENQEREEVNMISEGKDGGMNLELEVVSEGKEKNIYFGEAKLISEGKEAGIYLEEAQYIKENIETNVYLKKEGMEEVSSICYEGTNKNDFNAGNKYEMNLSNKNYKELAPINLTQTYALNDEKRKCIASFEINNKRKDIIRYVYKKEPPKIKECYATYNNLSITRMKEMEKNHVNNNNCEHKFHQNEHSAKNEVVGLNNEKKKKRKKEKEKKINIKYGNIFFLEILTEIKIENYDMSNYNDDEIKAVFYLARDERLLNYHDEYNSCIGIIATQPFPDISFHFVKVNEDIEKKKKKYKRPLKQCTTLTTCNNGVRICKDHFILTSEEEEDNQENETSHERSKKNGRSNDFIGYSNKEKLFPFPVDYSRINLCIVENEEELIKKLVDKINFYSPLSIVSYENDKYNISYLNQRCLALNMGNFYMHISKLNDQKNFTDFNNSYNKNIKGKIIESLYKLSNVANTSFENLCKHYLNINIPTISKYTLYYWYSYEKKEGSSNSFYPRNNKNVLSKENNSNQVYFPFRYITVRYFLMKIHFLYLIYDKIGFLKKKMNFCKYLHVDLLSLINRGSQYIIESFLLKISMKYDYVLYSPSNKDIFDQRPILHTPLVLQPKSSINFFPLLVFDFQSLYPSIVIAFNICYSTCIGTLSLKKKAIGKWRQTDKEKNSPMKNNKKREKINLYSNDSPIFLGSRRQMNEVGFCESISHVYNNKVNLTEGISTAVNSSNNIYLPERIINSENVPYNDKMNHVRGNCKSFQQGGCNFFNCNLDKEFNNANNNASNNNANNSASNNNANNSASNNNANNNASNNNANNNASNNNTYNSNTHNSNTRNSNTHNSNTHNSNTRNSNTNKDDDASDDETNFEFIRLGVKKKAPNVRKIIKNLTSKEIIITSNNTMYVKKNKRKGICTLFLEDILKTRIMLKRCINIYDKTTAKRLIERMEKLKMILNVATGYIGANFSGRMPCVDISESIISIGKNFLLYIIEYIKENYKFIKVLYGDTDSIFLIIETDDINYTFKVARDILYNVNSILPPPMYLNFEKVYCPSLLMTKKRYFGFAYKNEKEEKPTLDLKGVESIRSDQCNLVKIVLIQIYFIFYYFKNNCYFSHCCCCCYLCRNFFPNFICSCKESNVHKTYPCILSKMLEVVLCMYKKIIFPINDINTLIRKINSNEEDDKVTLYKQFTDLLNYEEHNVLLKMMHFLYKQKYSFLMYLFINFNESVFKKEIENILKENYEKIRNQKNDCCLKNPHNILKTCLLKEINENIKCGENKCFCNIKQALFFHHNRSNDNNVKSVFTMKMFYSHLLLNIKEVIRNFFTKIYDNQISYDDFIIYKKVKLGTYKGEMEGNKRKVPLPPQAIVAKKLLKIYPLLLITYKEKIPFIITKKLKGDKIYNSVSHPSFIRGIQKTCYGDVTNFYSNSVDTKSTRGEKEKGDVLKPTFVLKSEATTGEVAKDEAVEGKASNVVKYNEHNYDRDAHGPREGNKIIPRECFFKKKKKLKEINFDYYIQNLIIPPLKRMLDLLPFHSVNLEEIFYKTKRKYNWNKANLEMFQKNFEGGEKQSLKDNGCVMKNNNLIINILKGKNGYLNENKGAEKINNNNEEEEEEKKKTEKWGSNNNIICKKKIKIKIDEEENLKIRKQIINSYVEMSKSQNMMKHLNNICLVCANSEMEALACQYSVHCKVYFKKIILQENISRNQDAIKRLEGK